MTTVCSSLHFHASQCQSTVYLKWDPQREKEMMMSFFHCTTLLTIKMMSRKIVWWTKSFHFLTKNLLRKLKFLPKIREVNLRQCNLLPWFRCLLLILKSRKKYVKPKRLKSLQIVAPWVFNKVSKKGFREKTNNNNGVLTGTRALSILSIALLYCVMALLMIPPSHLTP